MAEENWTPRLQFRHGSLIGYSQYEGPRKTGNNFFKPETVTYSGDMTPGAKKRIRRCVDLLLQISPPRVLFNPVTEQYQLFTVNFITLTIPNEKPILASWSHKNLLEPFLRKMRAKYGLRHYVWKCERQERGQLHYHITSDTFIIWSDIRNEWNNVLRSAGLMKEFIAKHKHSNPNSTDVHAVHKIQNVAAYICKYVQKAVNGKAIDGKVWDASATLKNAKPFTIMPDGKQQAALTMLTERKVATCIDGVNCKIYKPKSGEICDLVPERTRTEYKDYLRVIALRKHQNANTV